MKPTDPIRVFGNGTAILPDRLLPDAVVCRKGRIVAVGSSRKVRVPRGAEFVDARGGYITPGFVEMHVHGGDAPLPDVFRMATLTPAERAGVARKVGSLEKGKLADVLVLNKKLAVKRVFIGTEEFRSPS